MLLQPSHNENDSYVCTACGGVVSSSRRQAHEEFWCSAAPDDDCEDISVEQARSQVVEKGIHEAARATLSSLCEEVTHVAITSLPGLQLSFEQQDIWGPLDTGGALWYADRVLAEYLALAFYGATTSMDNPDSRGLALVLGCGGAPLSGLVAGALGWNVILTDLGDVVSLTQRNMDRNLDVVSRIRSRSGFSTRSVDIQVMELPFGDHASLRSAIGNGKTKENSEGEETPLLVLCSDCVWQQALHAPLLSTIVAALQIYIGSVALICFQTRNFECECKFRELTKQNGLSMEIIDMADVLQKVQWPPQLRETMLLKGTKSSDDFLLYRVTLS